MTNCWMCSSEFENVEASVLYCSTQCRQALGMADAGIKMIKGTKPTEDSRIFFYPISFGTLSDMYAVMSLKRAHTPSIGNQQEMDYRISRLRRNLTTLLGQIFYDESQREAMSKLLTELFTVNAIIWEAKDKSRNERYDLQTRKDALYSTLTSEFERNKIIQQLDILYSGKTMQYKVHNGSEI